MQVEGDSGGGNISIGEEDQLRDQEMIRELQDEDGQRDDPLDLAQKGRAPQPRPSTGEEQKEEDD